MGRKHTDIRAFGADGTRSERLGLYMIENDTTIRAAASAFGLSKSTVHKELSQKLRRENPALYKQVEEVLRRNQAERHIRGGNATRAKYEKRRSGQTSPSEKRKAPLCL